MEIKREISLVVARNRYAEPDRFYVSDVVRIDLNSKSVVGEIVALNKDGLYIVEEDDLIWVYYSDIQYIDFREED